MNRYKGIKKVGKTFLKRIVMIFKPFKITKNQLHNLSLDLESDILPVDSIAYFIKWKTKKSLN